MYDFFCQCALVKQIKWTLHTEIDRHTDIWNTHVVYKEKLIQVYGLEVAAESDIPFPKMYV